MDAPPGGRRLAGQAGRETAAAARDRDDDDRMRRGRGLPRRKLDSADVFAGGWSTRTFENTRTAPSTRARWDCPTSNSALLAMAAVEREHEEFFLRTVAAHPWLPALKRVFSWGEPARAPDQPLGTPIE